MAAYKDRVYGRRVIVRSFYGSLQGQGLCSKGNCKEFVWQVTWTEFMVHG